MIEEARQRLTDEVQQLNHELHVVLPATLKKALAMGDLRENSDYHAAIERQQFIAARLTQLRDRLSRLSSIDLSKIPHDKVGLGSVVTLLDLDTKEQEVVELVIPDAMDDDAGHISVSSPIGNALLDRKVGEKVKVRLPFGERRVKIAALKTMHDQPETESPA